MVIMQVIGLTVDTATKTPLVVLQEMDGQEVLPIWIGAMEAMAISLALSGSALPRPLTHDLLLNTLHALGAQLESVDIVDLREGTYIADILVRHGPTLHRLDCRPSDGIALALRAKAPLRITPEVLRAATEARLRPDEHGGLQLIQPEDVATDMIRRATIKDAPPQRAPATHVTLAPPSAAPENKDAEKDRLLSELLQKMEPDSQRRM